MLETQPTDIKFGMYRHFKGGIYEVLGLVRHSETEEWLVLYKGASGEMWVRPHRMWNEVVTHEGQQVQRFTYIGRTA